MESTTSSVFSGAFIITIILGLLFLGFAIFITVLIVKALLKYVHSKDVRKEKQVVKTSVGKTLQECRNECRMTQEFVAETIGVSRQAVSKWENGIADPSTSNLFALAKLYGLTVEELLKKTSPSE